MTGGGFLPSGFDACVMCLLTVAADGLTVAEDGLTVAEDGLLLVVVCEGGLLLCC